MNLNVGGGALPLEGYLNVDLSPNADIQHDLKNPLPFPDASVDNIMGIHIIEHFYRWELLDVLKDWRRVLKPGGTLKIEFTVLSRACELYLKGDIHGVWGLYGNQIDKAGHDPLQVHRYTYEQKDIEEFLREAGFTKIEFVEAVYHLPGRDMIVVAS